LAEEERKRKEEEARLAREEAERKRKEAEALAKLKKERALVKWETYESYEWSEDTKEYVTFWILNNYRYTNIESYNTYVADLRA